MVARPFQAHPPGDQNTETYRQFVELQRMLQEVLAKISELEARIAALEP